MEPEEPHPWLRTLPRDGVRMQLQITGHGSLRLTCHSPIAQDLNGHSRGQWDPLRLHTPVGDNVHLGPWERALAFQSHCGWMSQIADFPFTVLPDVLLVCLAFPL